MKKKLALVLAAVILVLSLGLAACGGNDDNPSDPAPGNDPVKTAANDGVLTIGLDPEFPHGLRK